MNIIAVDDERLVLEGFISQLREVEPDSRINGFTSSLDALLFAGQNAIDLAFLDMEMDELDGVALADNLAKIHPECRILFVSGYPDYAIDAFRIHASGYLLKPVSLENLREEIRRLRTPLPPLGEKPIQVKTFGSFEIFTRNGPIQFKRSKSRELLAYLVDRMGAGCTSREIASILWEDKPYNRQLKNYVQSVITDMVASLAKAGAQGIILRKWNSLSVNKYAFDCDYYRFLEDPAQSFQGEYLSNYSWAEETAAYLSSLKKEQN